MTKFINRWIQKVQCVHNVNCMLFSGTCRPSFRAWGLLLRFPNSFASIIQLSLVYQGLELGPCKQCFSLHWFSSKSQRFLFECKNRRRHLVACFFLTRNSFNFKHFQTFSRQCWELMPSISNRRRGAYC